MSVEKIQIPVTTSPDDRPIGLAVPFNHEQHDFVTTPIVAVNTELQDSQAENVSSITSALSLRSNRDFKVAPATPGFDILSQPEQLEVDQAGELRRPVFPAEPRNLFEKVAYRALFGKEEKGSRAHYADINRGSIAVNAALRRQQTEKEADKRSRSSF